MADPKRSTTFRLVRSELDECGTGESKEILRLLEQCHLQPRNDSIIAALYPRYYSDKEDVPLVYDATDLPWPKLPTVSELRDMLLNALHSMEYVETTPSTGAHQQDKAAAEELICSLEKEHYKGTYSLLGLPCHRLDEFCTFTSSDWPGTLHESSYICDIMPSGAVLEPGHNDFHEVNTLICGTKVWFQFPPTKHNLSVMTNHYGKKKDDETNPIDIDFLRKLQGGVVFLQKPGETVYIAPFCPVMVFSTKTSVSASYEISTAEKLLLRLQNMTLFLTQNAKLAVEKRQDELRAFAKTMLLHLEHVMKGKVKDIDTEPWIQQIAETWNTVKDQVRELANARQDETWGAKLAILWSDCMLMEERKSDQKCWMCEETFRWNKRSRDYMKQRLHKHFLQAHWNVTRTPARSRKRNSSGEVLDAGDGTPNKRSRKSQSATPDLIATTPTSTGTMQGSQTKDTGAEVDMITGASNKKPRKK